METKVKEKMKTTKCKDRNCPFHGSLRVRGRNFKGEVKKIVGRRVIIEFVKSFIDYDIKITKMGIQKGLKQRAQRKPSEERRFYV